MKFPANLDWVIVVCALVLAGFGSAIIASVAPTLLLNQLIFYALSFLVIFIFSKIDYRIYFSLSKIIYLFALGLLLFTLFLGFESHGALRWIVIGPFRLQFSEIFKPFLIAIFASLLSTNSSTTFSKFLTTLLVLLLPIFLVFKQPDLGSASVYFLTAVTMIFLSEAKTFYLVALLASGLLSLPIIWTFLAAYQKKRILTFFFPSSDPLGSSYNAIQALITVGSGMVFGRGLGRGTQSHLLFLPERHTDFIFASVAEELGFLGGAALIGIYFVIIWRIFTLSGKVSDPKARSICIGIGSLLLFQVVINIGMNIGLLPVTGITLPFVSYGGSSLLATAISLGIVENIAISQNEQHALHIV